jgi:hypothetical protein
MTTVAGRELTLKDLIIAPDCRSAQFGFIRYELVRQGEEETHWQWVARNLRGSQYPSRSFMRIECAVDELIATVENLKVTVPID